MRVNAEILVEVEAYIAEYEPEKFPEQLYAEFGEIIKTNKAFEKYLKREQVQRDISSKDRRRIFIKWYINNHPNKSINQCAKTLARILFLSETTIYYDISGYGDKFSTTE